MAKKKMKNEGLRLPDKDTSTWRGLITAAQGFVAALPALAVGLWTATTAVPGCSEAIVNFIKDNIVLIAGGFGVSSGAVSFLFNVFVRKDVKNY